MGRKAKAKRDVYGAWLYQYQLRRERQLTQDQLAKLTGVTQTTLAYWERTSKLTGRKVILCLANVLGVSLKKLLRPEKVKDEVT